MIVIPANGLFSYDTTIKKTKLKIRYYNNKLKNKKRGHLDYEVVDLDRCCLD